MATIIAFPGNPHNLQSSYSDVAHDAAGNPRITFDPGAPNGLRRIPPLGPRSLRVDRQLAMAWVTWCLAKGLGNVDAGKRSRDFAESLRAVMLRWPATEEEASRLEKRLGMRIGRDYFRPPVERAAEE